MPDHTLSSTMSCCKLKEERGMLHVDGKLIRFGMKEFSMISRLNCEKFFIDKALYDEKKTKDYLGLLMNKDSNLTGNDLKEKIKSNRLNGQIKLKIPMVWFVHFFFLILRRCK